MGLTFVGCIRAKIKNDVGESTGNIKKVKIINQKISLHSEHIKAIEKDSAKVNGATPDLGDSTSFRGRVVVLVLQYT